MSIKYSDKDCPRCKDNKLVYTGIRIETGNPLNMLICTKCFYREFEPMFIIVKEIYGYKWMKKKDREVHSVSIN